MSDPVPTQLVSDVIRREYGLHGFPAEQELEQFVGRLALTKRVVQPGDNTHGVLFFSVTQPQSDRERVLTVMELFRDGGLTAKVAVTELESGDRLHFGPFSLSYTPRIHADQRRVTPAGERRFSDPRFSRFTRY